MARRVGTREGASPGQGFEYSGEAARVSTPGARSRCREDSVAKLWDEDDGGRYSKDGGRGPLGASIDPLLDAPDLHEERT
jgi:hypothetical protein